MAQYTQFAVFTGNINQLNLILKQMALNMEMNVMSVRSVSEDKYEILYQFNDVVNEDNGITQQ